jgi:MerR family transcriptional regulator, thiopeptide resistance regulator
MFEGFDNSPYEEEVRERWGHTEAHRESARRTSYGPEQWAEMQAEQEAIERELAELMRAGEAPTGEPGMGAVERHRQLIETWFYPCSPQMHRGLGEMYVADERFARHYDERAPGLATFVRDAIVANAERAGVGATG